MSGVFFHALKNNFIYLLCVLFIITPIQIFTAYLFFVKIPLTKYIRTMIFVPYVLSISIVGFFALLVFEGNTGILNEMITKTVGVQYTRAWLGDDKVMFPVFILVVIWQCASSGTMIFFADMQATPKEVIEASIVDGCGELSCFFHIILPGTYYGTTDIGFGSAISVVMLIIILLVWGVTNLFLRKMKEQ